MRRPDATCRCASARRARFSIRPLSTWWNAVDWVGRTCILASQDVEQLVLEVAHDAQILRGSGEGLLLLDHAHELLVDIDARQLVAPSLQARLQQRLGLAR